MAALAVGVALFGVAFAVHLLLWRIRVPRPATGVLLAVLFGVTPPALLIAYHLELVTSISELVQVVLFHVAASLSYVIVYSGIETASPTVTVAQLVERAGARGCSLQELVEGVSGRGFVETRLALLPRSGLAQETDGTWRLTSRGARIARLMTVVSHTILRLPKGG